MIRTFITPTNSNFNLVLEIPAEYLGQELELIVFKKQEGLPQNEKSNTDKISNKYRGVFTKEDAKNFNDHTDQMRKEWTDT
jgi:hypothetical protein